MARETSSDDSVLSRYLREINRIPLLTREQEENLARKSAAGDTDAKEALARANLRFVVNVAKRYQNQGLPLLDLISEGNIGLLHAIERFDVDKGYHFISYAVWWIKQAILKAVCEQSRLIRLPLNRANELVQIDRTRKELQSETGTEGTARADRRPSAVQAGAGRGADLDLPRADIARRADVRRFRIGQPVGVRGGPEGRRAG